MPLRWTVWIVVLLILAGWAMLFANSILLGMGALLGVVFTAVVFANPFLVSLAVVFTVAFGPFLNLPVTHEGFELCLAILFAAFPVCIVKALLVRDSDLFVMPFRKMTSILMLGFLAVMLVSMMNTSRIGASLEFVQRYMYCLVLYFFIVFAVKDKKQLEKVLWVFVMAGLLVSILGLIEAAAGKQLYALSFLNGKSLFHADVPEMVLHVEPNRIAGPHGTHEGHCLAMTTVFYVSLSMFLVERSAWKKWLLGIIALLAVVNVFGAIYKVGILALVVSFVPFCYFSKIRHKWLVIFSSIGGMTAVLLVIWVAVPTLDVNRLLSMRGEAGQHAVLRVRNAQMALKMFKEHPLVGRGPSGFLNDYPRFSQLYPAARQKTMTTHNLYLQILVDQGIIGLAVFILIMVSAAKSLMHVVKKTAGLYREISTALLTTLSVYFVVWLGSSALLFLNVWLVVAFADVINRVCEQDMACAG